MHSNHWRPHFNPSLLQSVVFFTATQRVKMAQACLSTLTYLGHSPARLGRCRPPRRMQAVDGETNSPQQSPHYQNYTIVAS